MAEIPSDLYAEWMAYDCIEPIDAAGVILKGLSGSGKEQPSRQTSWESAYSKMHKMATADKQVLMVPNGMTPQQVWAERKDEW